MTTTNTTTRTGLTGIIIALEAVRTGLAQRQVGGAYTQDGGALTLNVGDGFRVTRKNAEWYAVRGPGLKGAYATMSADEVVAIVADHADETYGR